MEGTTGEGEGDGAGLLGTPLLLPMLLFSARVVCCSARLVTFRCVSVILFVKVSQAARVRFASTRRSVSRCLRLSVSSCCVCCCSLSVAGVHSQTSLVPGLAGASAGDERLFGGGRRARRTTGRAQPRHGGHSACCCCVRLCVCSCVCVRACVSNISRMSTGRRRAGSSRAQPAWPACTRSPQKCEYCSAVRLRLPI